MKKVPVIRCQQSSDSDESNASKKPMSPDITQDTSSGTLPPASYSNIRSSFTRRISNSKETSTNCVLPDVQTTSSKYLPTSSSKSILGYPLIRRVSGSKDKPYSKGKATKFSKSFEKKKTIRKEFHKNDLVFATIEGHKPWPAIVIRVYDHASKKNTRMCSVWFYGSHQTGECPMKNLTHFLNNREKYLKKYRNVMGYLDAYREVKKALVRSGFESDDNNSHMSFSSGTDTPSGTGDSDESEDDSSGEEFGNIKKNRLDKKTKYDKLFEGLMKKFKSENKTKGGSTGVVITDDPIKFSEQYIMFQTMVTTKPPDFENKINTLSCAFEFDDHHKICTDKITGKMYEFKVEIKKNDVGVMKEIYNREHIEQFMADLKRMNLLVKNIEEKGVEQCVEDGLFTESELTNIKFQEDHEVIQNELKRLDEVRRIAMKNEITLLMYIDKLRKYLTVYDLKLDKVKEILTKLYSLDVTHVMLKKNIDVLQVILMLTGYKSVHQDLEFQHFVMYTSYEILKKWAKLLCLKIDETIPSQLEHVRRNFDDKISETSILDQIKLFDDVVLEEAPDFKIEDMFSADETTDTDSDEHSSDDNKSGSGDRGTNRRGGRRVGVATRGRCSARGGGQARK